MMDDYISRRAAINSIRGMEDVYINNLPPMICKEEARMELVKLPPEDVVEVVRCKDCKHGYEGYDGRICLYGHFIYCNVDDDSFCDNGERKDD